MSLHLAEHMVVTGRRGEWLPRKTSAQRTQVTGSLPQRPPEATAESQGFIKKEKNKVMPFCGNMDATGDYHTKQS